MCVCVCIRSDNGCSVHKLISFYFFTRVFKNIRRAITENYNSNAETCLGEFSSLYIEDEPSNIRVQCAVQMQTPRGYQYNL